MATKKKSVKKKSTKTTTSSKPTKKIVKKISSKKTTTKTVAKKESKTKGKEFVAQTLAGTTQKKNSKTRKANGKNKPKGDPQLEKLFKEAGKAQGNPHKGPNTAAAFISALVAYIALDLIYSQLIAKNLFSHAIAGLRQTPISWLVLLGYIALIGAMIYVYPKLKLEGKTCQKGAKYGLIVLILGIIPLRLMLFGSFALPALALVTDAIWEVIELVVVGMIIAHFYKEE